MRHCDQTTFALISVCSAVRAKGEFRTRARHQVGGRSQSLLRTCIGAYLANRKHSRTCGLLPRPVNFGLLGDSVRPPAGANCELPYTRRMFADPGQLATAAIARLVR